MSNYGKEKPHWEFLDVNPVFRRKICLVCDMELPATLAQCPIDKTALVPLRERNVPTFGLHSKFDDLHYRIPLHERSYVYRGRKKESGNQLVIKVAGFDKSAFTRFLRQPEMLKHLDHPRIVKLVEVGQIKAVEVEEPIPFFVTQYLDGEPIDAAYTLSPLPERLRIFVDLADTLQYAHDKGVIHYDLEPGNVLVDKSGGVALLDFGKGLPWIHGDNQHQQSTQMGDVFGTPAYIAPETCTGTDVSAPANVYSLGCIMYLCLKGEPPVEAKTWMQLALKKLNGEIKPILNTAVPEALRKCVMKSLSLDPAQRQQSMAELSAELQAIQL